MLNSVTLMGRLTRNPELRQTNSGVSVASFSLAVERDFAPNGGDKEVDYIDCVAWRGTADFVCKHFAKGSLMCVKGRIEIQSFTDREGNNRKATQINVDNVYFCESKKREGSETSGNNQRADKSSKKTMSDTQKQYVAELDDYDDDGSECPF